MKYTKFLGFASLLLLLAIPSYANNVAVSNVELKDSTATTIVVEFDLSQDNPFGDQTDSNSASFSDYIYVFVKYDTNANVEATSGWPHATLATTGQSADITIASDQKGAYIKASDQAEDLKLVWEYATDSVSTTDSATRVKVMAIEMVKVPVGNFIYNAAGLGGAASGNINSGNQTTISDNTTGTMTPASGWTNGYPAFYLMKYEVSQGQYADFLNTLSSANATSRFPGQNGNNRHTITGTYPNHTATYPNRAANFLSWDDGKSYASWAGLRPMTEMEFEKAARGGGTNTNAYPWGNTAPSISTYTFDSATVSDYYANYDTNATDHATGPLRVGHYLSADISRTTAKSGVSPYGIMDLSGNLAELVINCASTAVPANGDGTLTVPGTWPTAAANIGLRGGGWDEASTLLRVSDRANIAIGAVTTRSNNVGFRGARTP